MQRWVQSQGKTAPRIQWDNVVRSTGCEFLFLGANPSLIAFCFCNVGHNISLFWVLCFLFCKLKRTSHTYSLNLGQGLSAFMQIEEITHGKDFTGMSVPQKRQNLLHFVHCCTFNPRPCPAHIQGLITHLWNEWIKAFSWPLTHKSYANVSCVSIVFIIMNILIIINVCTGVLSPKISGENVPPLLLPTCNIACHWIT